MMNIIFYIIISALFISNIVFAFKQRNESNYTYRIVYFSRVKDWIFCILTIWGLVTAVVVIDPYIPEFLKFGIFSLLGKEGTNANVEAINQSSSISPVLTIGVFAFFVLFLPKAAYFEERQFRHNIFEFKKSIITNIKFGLLHCIVGVPIWIGLLLSIIGFIFTIRYILEYRKTGSKELALYASTSLHGKYNFILILLFTLTLVL